MTDRAKIMEPLHNAQPHEIEALFVQTAGGVAYHNGKLTLKKLSPTTLMFSDRPDRVTGHLTAEDFINSWDKGDDSFAKTPPNAVLSIFHKDGISDVVVELTEPVLAEDNLTYTVEILDGDMPASGGPSSLFIDTIGRPLSPLSVAGVMRREERRDRR
jgi:hypothetical protein